MIILGLDPGIARTGFGVIESTAPATLIRCGCLITPAYDPVEKRLLTIGTDVEHLITTHHPQAAIIEHIFFGANRKTAVVTAETRGVLLFVLQQHHVPVYSLTPLQIKSRLTGHGRATKEQIQKIVMHRLHLSSPPQPDDAADAVAAALCLADSAVSI